MISSDPIASSFRSEMAMTLIGDETIALVAVSDQLERLSAESRELLVVDQASAAKASDLVKIVNHLGGKLRDSKDAQKRPVLETGRMIDSVYRPALDAVEQIKSTLKSAQMKYIAQIEAQRAEAQKSLQPTVARTSISHTAVRKIRKGRVVDVTLVPRQYLEEIVRRDIDKANRSDSKSLTELLIMESDKMGIAIPGTEIVEESIPVTR